ncbi:alpha-latrotoxin-Lt1a-like [Hydra vulgaris]|uniref:alpha-latrotoxin-Lt1a-like n=1 Tax=Hydra vulgaris TaxID=6087 RepID=UPI0032EA24B9
MRITNDDTVHYDSRQQIFLAQQFYNALITAKNNSYANSIYIPGETLLVRQVVTDLFPNNYYGAYNHDSPNPTTATKYSQLSNNYFYKNKDGYYKYRLRYKINGEWKSIIFKQAFLPMMSMHYQNIAQLISTETPFGNTNSGQGFCGLNLTTTKNFMNSGAVLTLDTSNGYWAPVCTNSIFTVGSTNVIPVYNNYIENKGYKDNLNKIDFAAKIGRNDLIKLLVQLREIGTEDAIDNAAGNGHLEVIKYLHELGYKGTEDVIDNAAGNGHLEVIKYLHELGYRGDKWAIDNAAENGHLEVIKYLHELGYRGDEWAIDKAAENGHLEVIKYLHELGYKGTKYAIDKTAENGHLEVIKYLHELGYKGTKYAIDFATGNGHLEVIKYLHELGYKGTKYAIDKAAENGHLEVNKYLHELGYKGTEEAINNAAENGHLKGPENLIDYAIWN